MEKMERQAKKKQLRKTLRSKEQEISVEKVYLAIYNAIQFGGWYGGDPHLPQSYTFFFRLLFHPTEFFQTCATRCSLRYDFSSMMQRVEYFFWLVVML
jgi:hypothetical protein